MSISFDGIGEVVATFTVKTGDTLTVGDAVCLTGSGEVGLGSAGAIPCGVAVSVAEDGYAGVQLSGLAKVSWSGETAPAVGWTALAADGQGGVAPAAKDGDGLTCLVVSVDTAGKTAVIKL